MTACQIFLLLFCTVISFHCGYSVPISDGFDGIPAQLGNLPGYAIFLISAAAILLLGYVVIGCVCCPNHNIKALSYQNGFSVSRLNENNSLQFENPSEFAIFPPHSAVIDLQPVGLPYPTFEDKVTFEPLPDILPRKFSGQSAACSSRPAHFRALLKNKVSLHDWFDDPNNNFPRDHLQYIRELGCGWFGRVVEGEASLIHNTEEKTPVLVKILREEASPSEHLHFLHEVRPYRDVVHPNIVRLLGRCLESDPFLLIMEHSINDLKTFLVQHENKENFLKSGMPLQMACNIAAGLKCLHENGFTHVDLAAHNCFVCKDFTIKIGDYGISFDKCREDYYCLGGIALPIRWCSPETLLCTEATIETKEITKEANVWAFGIILWEIFELGKLPYEELTNEEVLQKVLIERTVQLLTPTKEFPVKEELYLIMKECWKSVHLRPSMDKIENFLTRLYNDCHNLKTLETSFEERWNSLQPKSIETKLLGTELLPLKFENDFSERSDSHNYSSDGERFSSFEMSYDMYSKSIGSHLSPSLRVLNGSIDELTENDVCLNSVSLAGEKSTADAASVLSDSDLPQLEDDHGNQLKDNIMPEHVSDAVRDFDMVLVNQLSNPSRQSHKFQLNGKKNSTNPFVAESCNQEMPKDAHSNIPIASHYYTEVSSNLNLQKLLPGQNANELKRLNNNNNEFQLISDEINRHNDGPEMMSTENSPDSINANKVVDFSVVKNELAVNNLEKNTMLTENKPVHSDDEINLNNQKLSDNLSAVPDIIVHESPSIIESSHDENENMVQEITSAGSVYFEPSRPFRFVFKDESVPEIDDENHVKISEETNSSQNTPNGTDSSLEKFPDMKYKPRSQHLTSTPLKNEKDNNLSYSSSFADEDLGNVFYSNSPSDNLLNNECTSGSAEEFFSANCEILKDTPASNEKSLENITMKKFNESLCNETTVRSDVSTKIIPSNVLVEKSIASVDFTSAQSSFNTEHVNNTLPISKHSNSQIIINNHVPSFVSEMNELNSSECLDKDIKLEEIKNSQKPDKYSVQQLESTNQEDIGCFDFGEPVTPEVSFNVSTCSYGNEGRSMSTDSPGISSENKDLEYDFEHSFQNKSQDLSRDNAAHLTNPDGLIIDTEDLKHAELLDSGTTQNYPTLDSEASGSEYLESFSPDITPDSFGHSDEKRMESMDNMRPSKSNFKSSFLTSAMNKTDLFYDDDDLENDSESDTNAYKSRSELRLHPYDEVIVEDLETGEQTIITESFSACDDYDNSVDSDEILKINIETDEAIIVDSSETLIGFVPSRSIELLQECEIIPTLNPAFIVEDEKESSDSNNFDVSNSASSSPVAMQSANSPCESPESTYPIHQHYRNFSLQNEVIEEEITDEIATPSSIHSTASFSSNEGYLGEEKMSQSSESYNPEVCETSILPSVDHFYGESDDGSRSDISNSDCSPVHNGNCVNNIRYVNDCENNHVTKDFQDVMYSKQPMQSVCWHSDDTLDIERDSPVILEGREILAGDILETRGMSVKDITATLNQLDVEDRLNRKALNRLSISQSPSPYSSIESSPCREAYTPDFESDSDDGGTSCSSTSGSFECIHNKFKDITDISKAMDESEPSDNSREQSPQKIFSRTWDCHATPSKSVLVTPEKKFQSLRKSVSFHEEDPQVVFEYPPASDSSEDGHAQEEISAWNIDYHNFADWDLHAGENEETEIQEILEIEELESEPYVRRPTYGIGASLGPMNRPMYSFTSGFSDDDMDMPEPSASTIPSESIAPSNSPEEGKQPTLSGDQISELIKNQLNNLALEESRLKWMQDELDQQSHEFSFINSTLNATPLSVHEIESNDDSTLKEEIVIEELLPESCENAIEHEDPNSGLIQKEESIAIEKHLLEGCENAILHREDSDFELHTEQVIEKNMDEKQIDEKINALIEFDVKTPDLRMNSFENNSQLEFLNNNIDSYNINDSILNNNRFSAVINDQMSEDSSNLIDIECIGNKQEFFSNESDLDPFNLLYSREDTEREIATSSSSTCSNVDEVIGERRSSIENESLECISAADFPLKFEEGNKRPNSIKNEFVSKEEVDKDSLQNLSTEKCNEKLTIVSDEFKNICSDLIENFDDVKLVPCSSLEDVTNDLPNICKEKISINVQELSNDILTDHGYSVNKECSKSPNIFEVSSISKPTPSHSVKIKDNEKVEPSLEELSKNAIDIETNHDTKFEKDSISPLPEDSIKDIPEDSIKDISEDSILKTELTEKNVTELKSQTCNNVDSSLLISSKGNDQYSFIEPKQTEIICDNLPLELSNEKATYDTKNLTEKNLDGDSIESGNCDEKIIENVERIPNEDLIREGKESSTFKIFEDKVEDDSTSQVGDIITSEKKVKNTAYNSYVIPDLMKHSYNNDKSCSEGESLCENQANSSTGISELCKEEASDSLEKLADMNKKTSKKDLDPLPQIVITPASESEIEDELEEYLRDQLEFFHGPSVTEGEDFSVTSQYSVRPFEDVFGSHHTMQNSGGYIEAFNFEFDSGDFFDDYLVDTPSDVSNTGGLSLGNERIHWWESLDDPPMIEKSSEDDLNSKSESSPLCYASKDSTHL